MAQSLPFYDTAKTGKTQIEVSLGNCQEYFCFKKILEDTYDGLGDISRNKF